MLSKLQVAALLCAFVLALSMAAQTTDATVSGTVTDPAGGAVAGARVVAVNSKTGVTSNARTNDAGVYIFASLQPGMYQVTAEQTGFQKYVLQDLDLDVAAQITLNLQLKLGTISESVEVQASAAQELGYLTSSVGTVVSGRKVLELPLAGRDAIGLLRTQPGITGANGGQNFNGARVGSLNVTVDGTNAIDNLLNSLFLATVTSSISVDRIEEFRVVTSPADAELGRGSGQIQAITRSGGNQFHGSLFNEHRDRSLTANNYFNNLRGQGRDFLIRNFFGGRVGGPVRKNKTFFNFFYEKRIERFSQTVTSTVYTATARQGLFRFYPGARNANAIASIPTVDLAGNPVKPSTATGDLQTVSVFGRDPSRLVFDPTGIVQSQIALMPLPNDFRTGDGLNSAGYTWNRGRPYDFNQFDIRVDHQFAERHRGSFTYSEQGAQATNYIAPQRYPTVPGGQSPNETTTESFTLTSTLRPNLLNEFHAGVFRPRQRYNSPWNVGGNQVLPSINGQPFLLGLNFANSPINPGTGDDPSTRISPVYQYSDSLTWLKGRHTFKGGFEARYVSVAGFDTINVTPRVSIGAASAVPVQNIITIPGIGQNTNAQTLLTDLSGSVTSAVQNFIATGGTNPVFLNGQTRYQHIRAPEYSGFFKDDIKLRRSLTVNLGIRYELYAVPVEDSGRGADLVGGSGSIFGISGTDYGALFHPGVTPGSLTAIQPIGPNTANPNKRYFEGDHNNFGPAVGLSWSLPWFGKDKTILRMGYGVGFERNPLYLISLDNSQQPGYSSQTTFTPATATTLANLKLPLQPQSQPLQPVLLTDRTTAILTLDSHLRTPYYQNFNVSLERLLKSNTVFSVRWVGNKGTKLIQQANINEVNIVENGILDAFRITQAGGNAPLFNKLFTGLPGVDGVNVTGSDFVRSNSSGLQGFLINNDVPGFAATINSTNLVTGQNGGLLRRVGLPENFIVANPQFGPALLAGNYGNSTYHSLQVGIDKRFAKGWTLQAYYTFSKALGNYDGNDSYLNSNFRTQRNRSLDKTLLSFNRTHSWKANGLWELPFGPGKSFGRNSHGILGQVLGGWQTGSIFILQSGAPLSLSAAGAFNGAGNNTPVAVSDVSNSLGQVRRVGNGVVYFDGLKQVADPYIAQITTLNGIQSRSTLFAITDASGKLLLQNPQPGQLGSVAPRFFTGPGLFQIDLNLLKRFKFKERYDFEIRADAINVTNTVNFGNPDTNINSQTFGRITGTNGDSTPRVVVLSGRFNF
jgi:hypothetical protein